MVEPKIAPYGSWKSPITSDLIVSKSISLGGAYFAGENIYWSELRPSEGGRQVIVRRSPDGTISDVNPAPYNVRTTVHEYGGRCSVFDGDTLYFSNFSDQRLYMLKSGQSPQAFTPERAGKTAAWRYADPVVDRRHKRLICVREDHTNPGEEAVNSLVSINLADGSDQQVLVSGSNFYSTPRLNPAGDRLAWLSWNHPNMPWDGTEMWVAEVNADGSLGQAEVVAGGEEESIFQPTWSPDGILYFVSDRSGWWNLYRYRAGQVEALLPMEAEFGVPQWVFGTSTYCFESPNRMICTYTRLGKWHLAAFNPETRDLANIKTPYTDIRNPDARNGQVLFTGGSAIEPTSIVRLDLETKDMQVLRRSSEANIDPGYLSQPEVIEFPTKSGLTAYANYYPPKNKDFTASEGELPPLLVLSHGGPTSAAPTVLNLNLQYWTSRGFAVVDVNYGGSTGYGRDYRERLNGNWGVVDVDDCVNAARFLVSQGKVDGERLAIRGGSAGGYTTLCALTFRDVFKAGASHFGIGDLNPFVDQTHKFESRYNIRLIGPYPERADLYYDRSAINFVDQISCPIILFQGLEDKIVPPNQSEMMFEAVRANGIPTAYLAFEGEQHGFRKAENIKRTLDAELYFYSRIFNFELAEPVEPVKIENLD